MNQKLWRITLFYALLSTLNFQPPNALAQGTAFTYQGRLNDGASPANGSYDLSFALFDAPTLGNQVGASVLATGVGVTNGLFVVTLDFGFGSLPGANRWLQINVRTNGNGAFTSLSPRQPLTPAPYAVTAENLVSGGLSGGYTNAVTLSNPGNVLSGNGAGLVGVNATTVGGLAPGAFWQTGGNAGTTPGVNYLGTSDNQPLELKAGGARAMRLEPNSAGAPNVIGGAAFNAVGPGFVGSTIGGGGATNYFGFYAYTNDINSDFGVIGGGIDNHIQTYAQYSTIGGGQGNLIQTNSNYSAIAGGYVNVIQANSLFSSIGGGVGNGIQANASDSTLGGGEGNSIQANADHSTIGGGHYNTIQSGATNSTIGGGIQNTIVSNSPSVTIAGGFGNAAKGPYAVVGGGYLNIANTNSTIGGGGDNTNNAAWGTIAGGNGNFIDGYNGSVYATISGGGRNSILAGNESSSIGGGEYNLVQDGCQGSFIGSGQWNIIQEGSILSVIAGGNINMIGTNATRGTIGGGQANRINNNTTYAFIAGGLGNAIRTGGNSGAIGGGTANIVAGLDATVPGGNNNYAGGAYSFAAGQGANAQYDGSFVWADSQVGAFDDTGPNQFLIRAAGGVGVGVTSPTAALDIAGSQRARGLFRNGSESGTSEAPSPAGLVVRRINSTSTAYGQVVAEADVATLIRDGTAGGMIVHVPGHSGKVTITWMGIRNDGTVRGGNFSADTTGIALYYEAVLFADGDNIVHAQITLGRTYLAGQHLTQVVIDRYDDLSIHDNYWSGTLTSTYNQ